MSGTLRSRHVAIQRGTPILILIVVAAALTGCAARQNLERADHMFARMDWDGQIAAAGVLDHDDCENLSGDLLEQCCMGLLDDIRRHQNKMDELEEDGSVDAFFAAIREWARIIDALDEYCQSCGHSPAAAAQCD